MHPHPLPSLDFRMGTAQDASRVCVLGAQVFLEAYATGGISRAVAQEVLEYFTVDRMTRELSYAAGVFILVESRGNLIGFAQLDSSSPQPLAPDGSTVELHRLYIHPRVTGIGLGTALLVQAETWARSKSAASVWATVWAESKRALAFFSHRGYHDVGAGVYASSTEEYENRVLVRVAQAEA